MKTVIALLLIASTGSIARAQDLFLRGDFSATLTGGFAYSGSFRGTIENPGTIGTALFHSDDFRFFEAQLAPSLIGETLFDASNLEVLLDIQNGEFVQLWFGGAHLGPNGAQEGVDDFFVQWSHETGTPPDSGFFSVTGSSADVTFIGGDLDIRVVPEPSGWMLGVVGAITLPIAVGCAKRGSFVGQAKRQPTLHLRKPQSAPA